MCGKSLAKGEARTKESELWLCVREMAKNARTCKNTDLQLQKYTIIFSHSRFMNNQRLLEHRSSSLAPLLARHFWLLLCCV